MFKNILVPTDFSKCSLEALKYARNIAQNCGAAIHLVHVVEPLAYPADWGYAQSNFAELEREFLSNGTREIEKLAEELAAADVKVQTAVLTGYAAETLVQYASENLIDALCIATHGRSGLENFLFGSTTERVLRKAPCPVIVVRHNDK